MIEFLIHRSIEQGFWAKSLLDKPELDRGNELIFDTFVATTTSRGTSIRYGKEKNYVVYDYIPLPAITAYFDMVCLDDPDQRRRVSRIVHRMDIAYLKEINPRIR